MRLLCALLAGLGVRDPVIAWVLAATVLATPLLPYATMQPVRAGTTARPVTRATATRAVSQRVSRLGDTRIRKERKRNDDAINSAGTAATRSVA